MGNCFVFMNLQHEKRVGRFPLRLSALGYLPDNYHEPRRHIRKDIVCSFTLKCGSDLVRYVNSERKPISGAAYGSLLLDGERAWEETRQPWSELFFGYPATARNVLTSLGIAVDEVNGKTYPIDDMEKMQQKVDEVIALCCIIQQDGVLDRLDVLAFEMIFSLFLPGRNASRQSLRNPAIRGIAAFLRGHFHEEIRFDEMLREHGLSKRTFHREWRKVFEIAPHNFLIELRLDHARELLRSSNDNLKEIAEASGFRNQVDLCRHFRKRCKTTADAYRRQCRKTNK